MPLRNDLYPIIITEKNRRIALKRASGMLMREIAKEECLSPARISYIVAKVARQERHIKWREKIVREEGYFADADEG